MKRATATTKPLRPRVLYVVYWGAGEPLGQSLVVPAVKRLAELGADITLVTFDKPADLHNTEYLESIGADFERVGVKWLPLRYHKRPKLPATLFDIVHGIARMIGLRLAGCFDIVHARTFVGGLMGLGIAPLIGASLIYHNEGFYPDEQVDGGVWAAGSMPHRLARWLELKMYSSADAILAMSRRGCRQIEQLASVQRRATPVCVVPSCVDLDLFTPTSKPWSRNRRLVYTGSVGGRYILDRVGAFVRIAAQSSPGLTLHVLTRAEPGLVTHLLHEGGLSDELWTMASVPYRSMPEQLERADAGLFFLAQGLSEHGCSPTKIGEYWAMGIPVVTTPNVSDIDEIIALHRVGVVVRGHRDEDYALAIKELLELLNDSDLANRCRSAAETYYALGPACDMQYQLYLKLAGRVRTSEKETVEKNSEEAA